MAITLENIKAQKTSITRLCQQYHAENIRVFGSVARGESTDNSDIDFSVGIFVIILFLFFVYGYIANLVLLILSDSITGLVIARAIGVFMVPLGAILGYI